MGRNFESPFIPSAVGSRLGLPFFSNSFMCTRSFLGEPSGAPTKRDGHASEFRGRIQYRRPFPGKSSELATARESSYRIHLTFPYSTLRRPPIALTTVNILSRVAVPSRGPDSRRAAAGVA